MPSRERCRVLELREQQWLPGWSDQSIWGYDEPMQTFIAQLGRDDDSNDEPTGWIGGLQMIECGSQLLELIASATGSDIELVKCAMPDIPIDGVSA
jgi:hypothetical protein